VAPAQNTSFDISATFSTIGASAYFVSAQSPALSVVSSTGASNPNPDLTLEVGRRYHFLIPFPSVHPFSIFALPSSNLVLRQTASRVGTFESDPAVDWFDDGTGNMYFTLTPALAAALASAGNSGRYTCEVHSDMEGNVLLKARASSLGYPAGVEDFNNSVAGTSIENAFSGWSIVNGSASYTAPISSVPLGHPGLPAGVSRWLRITDTDTVGSNRVYAPAILSPTTPVGEHSFNWHMDVESIAGANVLLVSQLFDTPYKNVAGLEVTDSGVNVVIVGTTDGGVGRAGATTRVNLYSFTDAGGFGPNNWVEVGYEIHFGHGEVHGHATGSDGTTHRTISLTGLALQGTADVNNFRWCIRNNAAGGTSTINYSNPSVFAAGVSTNVEQWNNYE
jgi:hypothetical protein